MRVLIFLTASLLSSFAMASVMGSWAPGALLSEATAHGSEPERILYVCKTFAHGGVHPGKVVAGKCNIGYGGAEETYGNFEVYSGPGRWVDKNQSLSSPYAVQGGHEQSGQALLVCLAQAHGGWHPGKVVGGNCNFGYGGWETVRSDYMVLVE